MATTVTKTVKSSGGDYSSLSAWEAGEQGNLVTLDEIHQAECYGFEDTTAVVFAGWTTDATRYIRIYTPTAERHDGKYNSAKYCLKTNNNHCLEQTAGTTLHIRLEGLQIWHSGIAADNIHGYRATNGAGGEIRVSYCLFRGNNRGDWYDSGIILGTGGSYAGTVRIWNNIFYDWGRTDGTTLSYAGMHLDIAATFSAYVYNNTVHNSAYGFSVAGSGSVIAKNTIVQDVPAGAGNQACYTGTFATGTAYNISDDATQPGTNGINGEVTFNDEANDDFHLGSGDSTAKDAGTDLSGDANLSFTDDIDSGARSGSWDIGADELAGGGGAATPSLLNRIERRTLRGVLRGVGRGVM